MSQIIKVSKEIAGRTLTLEVGKVAQQATAAVWAQYGETIVLATVVLGRDNPGLGYFPLSVEYSERLYASGKIKGSRWVKREGRPSDYAVLTGRLVDRAIRPLFPKEVTAEVQLIMTELSYDGENETDVVSFIAAAAALAISPIPWNGPLAGTKVGIVDGQMLANPTVTQLSQSSLDLFVAGTASLVNMIEAGGKQVPDSQFVDAVKFAHEHNQEVINLIQDLVKKINPTKITTSKAEVSSDVAEKASTFVKKYLKEATETSLDYDKAFPMFKTENPETDSKLLETAFSYQWKKAIRAQIATGKRTDGRKIDQIRPLSAEISVLPRVHGSAIFSRGSTQALTVATLATPFFAQSIETTTEDTQKRYIHHYNFPPFSTGSTDRMAGPKRREIGHGALAEKALLPVIPAMDEFPYTIRVVSDIMSSNGSTSQASVSGSTLALMDAGVPIKNPVAGVAMGLISDAPQGALILSDIAGIEDFNGDMDFKVAGTTEGITAVQLDVKIDGLSMDLVKEIIARARVDRLIILDHMLKCIAQPKDTVSKYAPKVQIIKIDTERIGEIIGPGGRIIRRIIAETGATVDVEDDGSVIISSQDQAALDKAINWVTGLTTDPEVGQVYEGTVMRVVNFGAFVEILPGKEGLVHVSKMARGYIESPASVVEIGQKVDVKVTEIDELGRLNLTMILDDTGEEEEERQPRRPRRDNQFNRRR